MKEITIDWIEYVLLKKEKANLEIVEEDKYKKIREAVIRIADTLYIQWDKKELWTYEDWTVELSSKYDWKSVEDVLHFEECTLWDLKENDVFVIKTRIYIIVKESDRYFVVNYLDDDIISREWFSKNDTPVIKILRN